MHSQEAIRKRLLDIIVAELRNEGSLSQERLAQLVRSSNHGVQDVSQHNSKKKALLYYLNARREQSDAWLSWNVDDGLDELIVKTLQVKPRRTASGVATITVVTKPAPCNSNCLYCPNDIRMPKSYLTDEPACQRAERNYFDPYLQVSSRLKALTEMGHATDKVEIIVLGGSWSDYAQSYQVWFITELFRALNDEQLRDAQALEIRKLYEDFGLEQDPDKLALACGDIQRRIFAGELNYNQAFEELYGKSFAWQMVNEVQVSSFDDLDREHRRNENAKHRVVGLVVETRPDTLSCESLCLLRRLGCTKVQIGVQSIDENVISMNRRSTSTEDIARAFELLRLFGFKIHAHYMLNLYGSNSDLDKSGYLKFMHDPAYIPDEVKLYPCVLVEGTGLEKLYHEGAWQPYADDSLIELLADLVFETPEYGRISRMIRDISAHDIMAGSKKTNLRQAVEERVLASNRNVREIRMREVSTSDTSAESLRLEESAYETNVSIEHFLQWVKEDGSIAGFLRLSLPRPEALHRYAKQGLPIKSGHAMIREVHIYGRAARLHEANSGPQHRGLGKKLIERAFAICREAGYDSVNVISAVGTREYYRKLGFADEGLYLNARILDHE